MTKAQKLSNLRERWKVEPHNRKIIEIQAKLLEMNKIAKKKDKFIQSIESEICS